MLAECINKKIGRTYSEENVAPIHQYHDNTTHPGEISEIAGNHQDHSDYMVSHHLYVVLSSSLSIENEDLVHVESSLGEII